MKKNTRLALAATVAAGMACTSGQALAQSADALLNKLVEKGVLTTEEAKDLRAQTDKDFTKAYAAKSGMPEWVSAFKINGDFRGRYEGFYADHPAFVERNRFRYRARLGFTAVMQDNFEVGMRLASGDIDSFPASGIDPISSNQSFQNNASKKGIFIDLAYGKWTAVKNEDWSLAVTAGKMANPFVFSDMVFDGDYTPEGAAFQLGYNLGEHHALKVNGGAFVLDEVGASTDDPYMLGIQARLESKWSKKISSSAGVAYLVLEHPELLSNTAVPNINRGNTRDAAGVLVNDYNPVVVDASVTYKLDSFPLYRGAFPIKLGGDYMDNSGASSGTDSDAWSAGITLGKAGKKGTWEAGYTYKWLGADAWWEEMVDSDFGAYYASGPLNGAGGAGYYAGTNMKGHIFRLAYSPSDVLTLTARLLITELINEDGSALTAPLPANTESDITRLQFDASLKF